MLRLFSDFLSVIYPRHCPLCDGLLSRKEKYLCSSCSSRTEMLMQPLCAKCGAPLADLTGDDNVSSLNEERQKGGPDGQPEFLCPECRETAHLTRAGFSPFPYDGFYRESIIRFKYGGRAEYAFFYAAAIWNFGREMIEKWQPELIIPVPLSKSRLRERGYNQSALIARELSAMSGIPVDEISLKKIRDTADQKSLSKEERRHNLKGAFIYEPWDGRAPASALVIDDVRTTGSTFDEAAAVLQAAGCKDVYFACVCQ